MRTSIKASEREDNVRISVVKELPLVATTLSQLKVN